MDVLPEGEGPQQVPRFLRPYQPTDVPRRLARPKRSVGSPRSQSRSDSQTPEVLKTSNANSALFVKIGVMNIIRGSLMPTCALIAVNEYR